jgi:hypothetical protein
MVVLDNFADTPDALDLVSYGRFRLDIADVVSPACSVGISRMQRLRP